eukprot:scaffold6880_cov110-Isochrysis_galbana.AAC.13
MVGALPQAWASKGAPIDGEGTCLEGILFIRRLDSAACALALRVGAWSTALVVNVPAEVFEAQCRLDSIVLVLDRVAVGARVVVYHLRPQTARASAD